MTLTNAQAREMLIAAGALREWHGELEPANRHVTELVDTETLLFHNRLMMDFACSIAMSFCDGRRIGVDYDIVLGVGGGGGILAHLVGYNSAHRTERMKEFLTPSFFFTDGNGENLGPATSALINGKKVLMVAVEVGDARHLHGLLGLVRERGGDPIGIGAIVWQSHVGREDVFGIPTTALFTLETWAPRTCPTCAAVHSRK